MSALFLGIGTLSLVALGVRFTRRHGREVTCSLKK